MTSRRDPPSLLLMIIYKLWTRQSSVSSKCQQHQQLAGPFVWAVRSNSCALIWYKLGLDEK